MAPLARRSDYSCWYAIENAVPPLSALVCASYVPELLLGSIATGLNDPSVAPFTFDAYLLNERTVNEYVSVICP